MAAKKPIENEEELEEQEPLADVIVTDPLTTKAILKEEAYKGPMVSVYLPALEEGGGMRVDQYEHVTIANEFKETCWKVLRGQPVEVPVPAFIALKERYGKNL